MKKTFTKSQGDLTEIFEITIEEKWIYVYYSLGETEKTAYIIKNSGKTDSDYLQSFWRENHVSMEIQSDTKSYLSTRIEDEKENWLQFSTFLIKAISYNLVIGAILGLSILAGFKLGAKADSYFSIYPLFTVIGVFSGISFGGYCGYVMIKHYLIQKEEIEKKHPKVS